MKCYLIVLRSGGICCSRCWTCLEKMNSGPAITPVTTVTFVTFPVSFSTTMTDVQHEPSSSSSPAPSTSSTLVCASPTSTWQAIRPWFPLLTLSVREVTSVSVTFLLSATTTQPSDLDIDIDLENELEGDEQAQNQVSIISEALAKGLSVKVNGSPWQRVFIRIDDSTDEAVIIIYGLMPGRQYDIDLGVVHARHLRRQVTTEGTF